VRVTQNSPNFRVINTEELASDGNYYVVSLEPARTGVTLASARSRSSLWAKRIPYLTRLLWVFLGARSCWMSECRFVGLGLGSLLKIMKCKCKRRIRRAEDEKSM
jgi:hypothetical protein